MTREGDPQQFRPEEEIDSPEGGQVNSSHNTEDSSLPAVSGGAYEQASESPISTERGSDTKSQSEVGGKKISRRTLLKGVAGVAGGGILGAIGLRRFGGGESDDENRGAIGFDPGSGAGEELEERSPTHTAEPTSPIEDWEPTPQQPIKSTQTPEPSATSEPIATHTPAPTETPIPEPTSTVTEPEIESGSEELTFEEKLPYGVHYQETLTLEEGALSTLDQITVGVAQEIYARKEKCEEEGKPLDMCAYIDKLHFNHDKFSDVGMRIEERVLVAELFALKNQDPEKYGDWDVQSLRDGIQASREGGEKIELTLPVLHVENSVQLVNNDGSEGEVRKVDLSKGVYIMSVGPGVHGNLASFQDEVSTGFRVIDDTLVIELFDISAHAAANPEGAGWKFTSDFMGALLMLPDLEAMDPNNDIDFTPDRMAENGPKYLNREHAEQLYGEQGEGYYTSVFTLER